MAGVRSNFTRQQINVSGDIENPILVFDTVANASQTHAVTTPNMAGIDMANWSDNFVKFDIILSDTSGVDVTENVFLLPNSSESYNFDGKFIKSVSAQAVAQPTATGLASTLLALDPVTNPTTDVVGAGLIDVNFIER